MLFSAPVLSLIGGKSAEMSSTWYPITFLVHFSWKVLASSFVYIHVRVQLHWPDKCCSGWSLQYIYSGSIERCMFNIRAEQHPWKQTDQYLNC